MSKVFEANVNLHLLDELARRNSVIHRIHPVVKLLVTLIFIIIVVSFDRYQVREVVPLILFPIITIQLAELPAKPILYRLLLASPFIIGIGILNPLFDPRGWLTFLSLVLKGSITVTACLVLVATTGMNQLAQSLSALRIPKLFITIFLLTFRYISLIVDELSRMIRAYLLRAPNQKGIKLKDSGSFAGQLFLRSVDRAERIYHSMMLRGFRGTFPTNRPSRITANDWIYLLGWTTFFILCRRYDLPLELGKLLLGTN